MSSPASSSSRSLGLQALVLAGLISACVLTLASLPWGGRQRAGQFQRQLRVTGPVSLRVQTGAGDVTVQAGAVIT